MKCFMRLYHRLSNFPEVFSFKTIVKHIVKLKIRKNCKNNRLVFPAV